MYIQEVGALSLLATSDASQRPKIAELANALPALLEFATKSLWAHCLVAWGLRLSLSWLWSISARLDKALLRFSRRLEAMSQCKTVVLAITAEEAWIHAVLNTMWLEWRMLL